MIPARPVPPSPPLPATAAPAPARPGLLRSLALDRSVRLLRIEETLGAPRRELPPEDGATHVADRAAFERLARRDDTPGALGLLEVKLLMTGVDTEAPTLYFLNTQTYPYHYYFATQALGLDLSLPEFNRQTYFTDHRKFLAGALVAHDTFTSGTLPSETPTSDTATGNGGGKGLYALEFWPTDPVKVASVALTWEAALAAMPFAAGRLAYHPAGETHRELYESERSEYEARGIRHVSTEELLGNVTYSPLNLGVGYGLLRRLDAEDRQPPTVRDVVIFRHIPNDLTHVAGVITEEPQTPLSHINLKAKQNDTPNAYLKDAAADPRIAPLLGRLVRLEVAAEDLDLREVTAQEVEEFLESLRPAEPQLPRRDLDRLEIADLDQLGHEDLPAYGAKAANVAELRRLLTDPGRVPDGFAVPFAFYDRFMTETGLYEKAREMIADADFQTDPEARDDALRRFRKKVRKGEVPEELRDALGQMQQLFPPDLGVRCRSSTNNEDLEGFNGAGLYDSYTHRPDEGHIEKSIRQVWASLWNRRAFEERDFYRIDHFAAAMGVLVHPNFDDERANGVALTRNLFDPEVEGCYVNAQVGEDLVTNPEGGAVPEAFLALRTLVSESPPTLGWETLYLRSSNRVEPGRRVLSAEEIRLLVADLQRIQKHFARVYRRTSDPGFAMDVEFKIDRDGALVIKQARPWVE